MIRRFALPLVALVLILAACSEESRLESGAIDADTTEGAVDGPTTSQDEETPTSSGGSETTQSDADPDDSDGDSDDPEDADSDDSADADDQDEDDSDEDTAENSDDEGADDEDGSDEDDGESADADDDTTDENDEHEEATDGRDDESATELTGPGSASAASGQTLVPVTSGESGDEVLALQNRLAELGFAPGTPDGSYGKRTTNAILAFQDLVDLPATGAADARTINALVTYRYDGLVLRAGDEGEDVETLQLRLSDGPFDPGPSDGQYGTGTVQAVWALEKMAGIPVDGNWGPLDEKAWERLQDGSIGNPEKSHDTRWVEVDLSDQLMKVYDPGSTTPTLVSHASSGSGIPWSNEDHSGSSVTPLGDFHINRRISGWRESSLNIGRLYNPLYFNGGIAFHGATSVPLYPASHGCVRLPMHIADYLPAELPNGTPVHILS